MGYQGVEFAGFHGLDPREIKRELESCGLEVAGTHTPLADLLGDKFDRTVESNAALGNSRVICPSLPEEYRHSLDAWKRTAGLFNELAEKLAGHGMTLGYHNHAIEFEPVDGVYPWDVFYGNVQPSVIMQLDTGNALAAGVDVAPFLEKYPNRSATVHLKEYSRDPESAPLIGEGDVNWPDVLQLCCDVGGTEWFIVEQEAYAHPPMTCVRICLENLQKMLGHS